jgi:beta-mannosidase
MKTIYDLATLPWQLSGWRPEHWRLAASMETGWSLEPEIKPMAATVPGSVQHTLRHAGLLPDWNIGLQSRECEWVENRHWVFQTIVPATWTAEGGRKLLRCDGLDYRGVLLLNGREVGRFCGSLVPYVFDLTGHLKAGENKLMIVFTGVPDYLGQICWTSRIRDWKPRFNYCWDWTPRIVQIGIWDSIRLEVDHGQSIESLTLFTDYDSATRAGDLRLDVRATWTTATHCEIGLKAKTGATMLRHLIPVKNQMEVRLAAGPVEPWNPNGNGPRTLYDLEVNLLDADGTILDRHARRIGFRQIVWKPCAQAPADALPWRCCINGVDTFLQGFNWVPLRPNFADVGEADYRRWLETYRDMGTNILRVWGGGFLEKQCFYDICDELGILVWQEFPLSSSGIDNWPPEDTAAIDEMRTIAEGYIRRRQHHPSLLLWCGGNELQGGLDGSKTGTGKPVDLDHPMMRMLGDLVRRADPTRRFLPSSSSGPRFMAAQEDFGKGLHHDVHGPWNHRGNLSGWSDYWGNDDALFRSETGMPGACSAELIRTVGLDQQWPGSSANPYWLHTCAWWIQWDDYIAAGGNAESLDSYVAWSQQRQAEALSIAARACKSRFPRCGGIIIWMGHDTFPCPVNTSVIDFYGARKPAADALAAIFRTPTTV